MKRLFISMPMNGLKTDDIRVKMNEIKKEVEEKLGEPLELINSIVVQDPPKDMKAIGAWYLGKSLQMMANADCVYFADGFKEARGCKIEYMVAKEYGLTIL